MNKPSKISAALVMAFAAVALTGCGGGSDSPAPAPAPTPSPSPSPSPSPAAASDATVTLVRQLVGQGGNNTSEPLVLSNAPFVTSDNTEPEAI